MSKLILFFICLFSVQQGFTQWNNDPAVNNIVANTDRSETRPFCVTDGAGGSIIIFQDENYDIYAQGITSQGEIMWEGTSMPVVISNEPGRKYTFNAVADGNGGAFIAWEYYPEDFDLGEIFLQHISARGEILWATNGINVTNSNDKDDYAPFVCSDGTGGVIVGWNWDNYVNNIQVSAQRYNSEGIAQWAAGGVQVCTAPGFRRGNNIVSDGATGAILFFTDTRDDANGMNYNEVEENEVVNANIYAQRLNGNGMRLWTDNGIVVCAAIKNQYAHGSENGKAVSAGSGGAIIAFDDERNDIPTINGLVTNQDIYTQKVNSDGLPQWGPNGVPVTTKGGFQYLESVVSDGSGGIVLSWDDDDYRVYSQKVNNTGTADWTINGIAISTPSAEAFDARVIADGAGNYIYSYTDYSASNTNLFAQKVNASGALKWGVNGVPVSNAPPGITSLSSIVASDYGGAIISWSDYRNAAQTGQDVFASKLLSSGELAGGLPSGYISVANGNWNDPATWLGGVVPPATAEVIVKHNVTVTTNASCSSVTVDPPGMLVIATGVKLTIEY